MPIGPGAPNPSGFPGFNAAYGIVAHSGGGLALATPLPSWLNTVTVVAANNDSVVLPPCYAAAQVIVVNNQSTTNACAVFAYVPPLGAGDQILTSGASTSAASVAVGQFKTAFFVGLLGEGGTTGAGQTGGVWKLLNLV